MTELEFIHTVKNIEDKMFRLAKSILISEDEAADAVQEICAKLWLRRDTLDEVSNKEAYFFRAVKNYCLDRLKSKQAKETRYDLVSFKTQGFSSEKKYEKREAYNLILQLMSLLPEKQRMIIQLRDIEGYEFKEIASILDMKENAIRTALSRARKSLKEALIKQYEYGL
jgi:RNA polymerase sigma-70 factor (ECF subfamily)